MKKFKNWLQKKINKFLGVDDLKITLRLLQFASNFRFKELEKRIERLESDNRKYKSELKRIIDTTHLGVDVRTMPHEHSWAVVCIPHKNNGTPHIDFFDLSGANPQYLSDFLKQFKGNKYVDATPSLRQFILK